MLGILLNDIWPCCGMACCWLQIILVSLEALAVDRFAEAASTLMSAATQLDGQGKALSSRIHYPPACSTCSYRCS